MEKQYKIGALGPFAFADAKGVIEHAAMFNEVHGNQVAWINMSIAPPAAPLGDVRPASSGPVSFGVRIEDAVSGAVRYIMAEPVCRKEIENALG